MELAELAQEHADGCSLTKKKDLWTPNCKNVGQLYHSTPASDVPVKDDYVPSVLAGWASRGTYYNYEENVCTNFVDCRPYTQVSVAVFCWCTVTCIDSYFSAGMGRYS